MKPIKNHLEKRMIGNYNIDEHPSCTKILRASHYQIKSEFFESPKQILKNKNILDRYKDLEQTLNKKEKDEAHYLLQSITSCKA